MLHCYLRPGAERFQVRLSEGRDTTVSRGTPHRGDDSRFIILEMTEPERFPFTNCRNDEIDDAIQAKKDFLTQEGDVKSVGTSTAYRAFGSRTCRVLI
jgi:hypothetical protein